jgi:hypothetical protein
MAEGFFQTVSKNQNEFAKFAREVEHDPSQLSKVFLNADQTLAVPDKKQRDDFLTKFVAQADRDYDEHAREYLQKTREAEQRGLPKPNDEAPLPRFELTGALGHAQNVELKVKGETKPVYSDKVVTRRLKDGQLEHFEDVVIGNTETKIDIAQNVTCSAPGQTYFRKQDCR